MTIFQTPATSGTPFTVHRSVTGQTAGAALRPKSKDSPPPTEQLLRSRARLPRGDAGRDRLRAQAVEANLPLANRLARRYAGRGEHFDDLAQVAAVALIRAVDGYDPERDTPFVSYAVPTILGAIKRHFRDTAWGIRVPRSTQELLLDITTATETLTQVRGRSPDHADLADYLHVNIDVLRAAIRAGEAYRPLSLNSRSAGPDSDEILNLLGAGDPHYAGVDNHLTLQPLIAALSPRDRRILALRFYDEMTQARIAAEIGLSQMHVSRLLRRTLTQLRVGLVDDTESR